MGVSNFDVVQARCFIGAQMPTQGNVFFVRPGTGSDSYSGKSPKRAFKTLVKALAAATANQNDIVFFMAESNTSADCTDYQTVNLDWNKDLVHLIGVNNGVSVNPRSRIAPIAGWTSVNPTMTVSANGCLVSGLSIWMGVTDATPLGCLKVTGSRNRFERCHILGIGQATNDIAGAYSLLLSGAAENEFHECTIGGEIVALGSHANSQILVAAGAFDNRFFDCEVKLNTTHATNALYLRVPTTTMLGSLIFTRCRMVNHGTELTYGSVIHASAGGHVVFDHTVVQAADINSSNSGNTYVETSGANTAAGLLVPSA